MDQAQVQLDTSRGRWVLVATILGSGMVFLDATVINVVLPPIQKDLAAPLSGLQWILDAYILLLAAFLLMGGALGDIYGRKRVFVLGLIVFTVSSAACAFAPNLGVLIGARAVQGIGGALLVPGSLAMIKAVIVPEDSGRAIGLWTGLSGATTALGPLAGGYIAQAISWRGIFFLNVPLAALTIWVTLRHVPENRDPGASRDLDIVGALLSIVGLGGLTFGLIEGPDLGWGNGLVVIFLAIGVLGLLAFPFWERRIPHPMMPLYLFRSRDFSGSNLSTLLVYFCFNGVFLFVVLNLQQVQGYTPLQSGASIFPITVLLLLLSPRVGGLVNRFGTRWLMVGGSLIITLGFVLLLLVGRHASFLESFLPGLLVLGFGMSIYITPLTTTVMGSVPARSVGVGSGINNAVSRVAALLAIAVLGAIVATRFNSVLTSKVTALHLPAQAQHQLLKNKTRLADDPVPKSLSPIQKGAARAAIEDAFLDGYRWAMLTCALLCLLSAVLCTILIRYNPLPPEKG
jgi:EmrB/QacA subfamily drug resistance transporter